MIMNLDYACFGLLGFIWGTNFLLMKLSVQIVTPLQVLWLRILCGALPLWAFGLCRHKLKLAHARFLHHFAILALTSTIFPFLGFVLGTRYLKSGAAGSIAGIVPLLTAALAAVVLPNDRLTWRKTIGLLSGCFGVALVADALGIFFGGSTGNEMVGLSYMLGGSVSYAVAVVYTRRFVIPLRISPLALAAYQTAIASVVMTLVTPFSGLSVLGDRPDILALGALGLGVIGTGLSFIMYYHVIERLGAVAASSVFYLPPVSALAMGCIFANERIAFAQVFGAAFIMFGIYLARPRAPLTRSV
jgi:drug/metabolite transporter (DMT)-like permease